MAICGLATVFIPDAAELYAGAGDLFASNAVNNSIVVYALDDSMRTFAAGLK